MLIVRGLGTNLSGGVVPKKTNTVVVLTNGLNKMGDLLHPGVGEAPYAGHANNFIHVKIFVITLFAILSFFL